MNFKYYKLETGADSISILLAKPFRQNAPTAYILDSTEAEMTYKNPLTAKVLNDSILCIDLGARTKLRQFRIYFNPSLEVITIRAIRLHLSNKVNLDLRTLTSSQLEILNHGKDELSFKVLAMNGYTYIESPKFCYPTDYPLIILSTSFIVLIFYLLFVFIEKVSTYQQLVSFSLQEISVILFIISILLAQRYFNIALIISVLLCIKNFKIRVFLANRANLYFVALYCIIMINFFFVSSDNDFKNIEKYTLLLVLPIYMSCIQSVRLGILFCISAIVIGGVLLFGALIDLAVFRNLEIISFENFTRSIHPVYYSYLISFSIFYVELTISQRYKFFIQTVLILLLILCGSKLIILSTLLLFALFLVKRRLSFIVIPLVVLGLFLFTPAKNRMLSIINLDDLSIVSEKMIKNPHDPRLNGLTLRLIIWQESLNITNIKDLILGSGVGLPSDKLLEQRLNRRGLTDHLWYNAHNQYLTTLFKVGFIGLMPLILLLSFVIRWAFNNNDRVLLLFTILMSIAMLSESMLERASGIALFCTIILFPMNTKILERIQVNEEIV